MYEVSGINVLISTAAAQLCNYDGQHYGVQVLIIRVVLTQVSTTIYTLDSLLFYKLKFLLFSLMRCYKLHPRMQELFLM